MQMSIHSSNFRLTPAIAQHAQERANLALDTAASQIRSVSIGFKDVNGARGGVDKSCRMTVALQSLGMVVVEAVHQDLYAAIDEAAGKVKDAVWRHIKRRNTLGREYASRGQRRQPA